MVENNLLAHGNMHLAAIALNHKMLPVFLGILHATAIAWLFLSSRLYAELRHNYQGFTKNWGVPGFS